MFFLGQILFTLMYILQKVVFFPFLSRQKRIKDTKEQEESSPDSR